MKGHKKVTRGILDMGGSVEYVIQQIRDEAEGLVNPRIEDDGYDYPNYYVSGWLPFTDEEKKAANAKARKDRVARKALKERRTQEELENLQKLAEKHGMLLVEGPA